jgi:hypothetical protein
LRWDEGLEPWGTVRFPLQRQAGGPNERKAGMSEALIDKLTMGVDLGDGNARCCAIDSDGKWKLSCIGRLNTLGPGLRLVAGLLALPRKRYRGSRAPP